MFYLTDYTCGTLTNFVFDGQIPTITSTIVTIIQIGVPLILIIMGMLDLGKAVMAQKEDEIKKGQQTFIKRVIAAILVFFVVAITQLIIGLFAEGGNSGGLAGCMNSIINCSSDPCPNAE